MAMQRGLLGVKVDPKKPMLFSFNAREGEEWPDDDDDSDYEPDVDDAEYEPLLEHRKGGGIKLTIKKSRIKNPERRAKKRQSFSDDNPLDDVGDEESSPKKLKSENGSSVFPEWSELPPELLLRIFQFITDQDGALPILPRLSRVCSTWSEVAKHQSLWSRVDLSYGWIRSEDRTLIQICPQRLTRTREINLSSWRNLTDVGIELIAQHCPLLESLDISYCIKVKGAAIQNLVNKCTKLNKLNISFLNAEAVKSQTLQCILEKRGESLRSLEMSGNKYTGFNSVLNVLQNASGPGAHCRNLQVLDISNCWFSTDFIILNLEKLQHGLPLLTVLRLANSKLRASNASGRVQAESPGFPKLKELSIAVSTASPNGGIGINDEFVYRVLKTSLDLQLLDLRGTSHVSLRGLQIIPISNLEQLYLSQSSVAKHIGLAMIMHKWRHSLRILDLSWNAFPDDDFELAMEALAGNPEGSHLEVLHLSGTSVQGPQVRSVLRGCPKLTTLHLTSCRGLPRGMKRDYTDNALDDLRQNIDDLLDS